WVTHKKPTLSDLYLIHQQGWEGAAEHISQPDRIAWKSMCATGEGREKGEKWCKRAIWRNTLPAVKDTWKSVDKLTSGAFVGMWRERVAEFYSKYMTADHSGFHDLCAHKNLPAHRARGEAEDTRFATQYLYLQNAPVSIEAGQC